MHATACNVVLLIAAQLSTGQLAPVDKLDLQPVPMSVDLNAPVEQTFTIKSRNSLRGAPAASMQESYPQNEVGNNPDRFQQSPTLQAPSEQYQPKQRQPPVIHDPRGVARTSHNDSIAQVDHEAGQQYANSLMRLTSTPLTERAMPGRPLSLAAALENIGDRNQQFNVVKAYWRLSARIADYNWAVKEAAFLSTLRQPQHPSEHSLLMAARAEAQAREYETRIAAIAGQQDLGEMLGLSGQDLPVTTDTLFAGNYSTKFEKIFAGRTPPTNVFRLAKTIPIQHELVEARASAVNSAFESQQATEDLYTKGQSGIADVLRIFDRVSRLRSSFVMSIRDYNQAIAEYSLSVIGPGVDRQTIVSTLILTSPQNRTAAPPQNRGAVRSAWNESPSTHTIQQQQAFDVDQPHRPANRAHGANMDAGQANHQNHQPSQQQFNNEGQPWRKSGQRSEPSMMEPPGRLQGGTLQDPVIDQSQPVQGQQSFQSVPQDTQSFGNGQPPPQQPPSSGGAFQIGNQQP